MCGISCCLTFEQAVQHHQTNGVKQTKALAEELEASLDLIKHRGPDSRGKWISLDETVALGHVRLSINDLSPDGAQPFHDSTNQVHAVVNGELYDHDRIRAELKSKTDYKFKGRSDCEIVIALYQYYGLSFLSQLRGEFALCLYDERNQIFIAARDRYGIKPLFWTQQGNRMLIAAEAKAFLGFGWEPEWDVRSLKEGGWNFDQRTVFEGVNKVRPGHYMIVRPDGTREEMPYWDIDFPNKAIKETRSEQEMIEGVRERLLDSVRLRLRADVPVGVYLSGGIDSSVIAGMVTHLIRERGEKIGNDKETERVSCFSIAFDEDSGFDESAIANRTADFLGVKYYKKHMNEAELAARFEDATWHCEHHNPDLNYVGKYALSEVPLELGYKVVLTGEGADETYAGYPMYLSDYLREPDVSWPSELTDEQRTAKCGENDAETIRYYQSIGARVSTSDSSLPNRILNGIMTAPSMTAFSPASLFSDWTSHYGPCNSQLTIANNVSVRTIDKIQHAWHPLNSALYVWSKGHLANIFLSCLGDRTEMAHSIEARTPFLDHELTDYVYGLPPSVKIRYDKQADRFIEKWILREAAKPFITKELYERKKHVKPYSAPTTYPENGPLHKLLAKLLTKENVDRLGFVDWAKANVLVEDAFAKKNPQAMRFALVVAQWVVLSQRFGIKQAQPPPS